MLRFFDFRILGFIGFDGKKFHPDLACKILGCLSNNNFIALKKVKQNIHLIHFLGFEFFLFSMLRRKSLDKKSLE
jgi:hypothetical protein